VDEVINKQVIFYDRKRKSIMRRKTKKRRLMMDNTLLINIEEKFLNTENVKTTKLIGIDMDMNDATLDQVNQDEKELATKNKELDYMHHMVKYYKDSMQATFFLKSEFREAYAQYTSERHLFTPCIANFQEDTPMALTTCKDMEIWYEKEY
jgi:hypothetical protein